jgi:hypothetical protein
MAERSPIYSARTARQQIGYIEDVRAFDLLGRPCATYDCNTGLLRDPNNDAIVGYVTLANIFVGAPRVAEQIFPKAERASSPQVNSDERDDEAIEDHLSRSQQTLDPKAAEPLSSAAVTMSSSAPTVQEHRAYVAIINAASGPCRHDEEVGTPLAASTGAQLENLQQPSQPTAGVADENPTSDLSRAVGDASNARATKPADAHALNVTSSDDGAEYGELGEPPSPGEIPAAVEAFMRHLAEYLDSNAHRHTTPSAETDGTAPSRSASSDTQKHTDRALLSESDLLTAGDDLALQAVEEEKAALVELGVANESAQDEPVVATELAQNGTVLESPAEEERVVEGAPIQNEPLIADCGESVGENEPAPALAVAAQGPSGEQICATKEQISATEGPATSQQRAVEDNLFDAAGDRSRPSPMSFVDGEAWAKTASDQADFDPVGGGWASGEAGDVGDPGSGEAGDLGDPDNGQSETASQADSAPEQAPSVAFFDQDGAVPPGIVEGNDGTGQGEDIGGSLAAANESATADDRDNSGDVALAKVFFDVDAECAVAVTKSELGRRAVGRAGGEAESPEDLFSVDIERAARVVWELLRERAAAADDRALHSALGGLDLSPTQEISSADMDRILRTVLRELEKK